jgi:hypothetical protein
MANSFLNYSPQNRQIWDTERSRFNPALAAAKDLADLKSYSTREIVIEEEGIVKIVNVTQSPETDYNKGRKKLGDEVTFTEYYVVTARSPVGYGNQAIDYLQGTSAKLCYDGREMQSPITVNSTVRVQYSSDQSREGKIVAIIGDRPPVTDESGIGDGTSTYKKWARQSFNDLVCKKSSDVKSKPDAVNGRAPTGVDYKKAPLISFYSAINCSDRGPSFNPSPDGSSEEKMSKYFTLADLTVSGDIAKSFGVKNTPDDPTKANLKKLATEILDPLVDKYKDKYTVGNGRPFFLNSAFRNLTINALVAAPNAINKDNYTPEAALALAEKILETQATGQKGKGPHVIGQAADISFPVSGDAMLDLFEEISKSSLPFAQIILESTGPGSIWFHIGIGGVGKRIQMYGPWVKTATGYDYFDRKKVVWDDSTRLVKLIP